MQSNGKRLPFLDGLFFGKQFFPKYQYSVSHIGFINQQVDTFSPFSKGISNFAPIFSLDKGRDCVTIKENNVRCSFVVNSKGDTNDNDRVVQKIFVKHSATSHSKLSRGRLSKFCRLTVGEG